MLEQMNPVKGKGKSEPIEIYFVEQLHKQTGIPS